MRGTACANFCVGRTPKLIGTCGMEFRNSGQQPAVDGLPEGPCNPLEVIANDKASTQSSLILVDALIADGAAGQAVYARLYHWFLLTRRTQGQKPPAMGVSDDRIGCSCMLVVLALGHFAHRGRCVDHLEEFAPQENLLTDIIGRVNIF